MNPLDIVMNELNTGGVSVELKRHRQDGNMETAKPNELATLATKSKLASTAALLKNLPKEERFAWAVEMKAHGNEFYAQGKYEDAMNTYVEALTASDFGTTNAIGNDIGAVDSSDNVDIMVVPVLCNLGACCLQLNLWNKAALFCQQALLLRPKCHKALMRKGHALFKMKEYVEALAALEQCNVHIDTAKEDSATVNTRTEESDQLPCESSTQADTTQSISGSDMTLTETDKKRVLTLILHCKKGIQEDRKQLAKQSAGLRKAFNQPSDTKQVKPDVNPHASADTHRSKDSGRKDLMSGTELLVFFLEYIWECIISLVVRLLGVFGLKLSPKRHTD